MAALEKIRKRAAILTIVIGAGLLAFILEEAVRASGAFGRDDLALKVGDEKVDIMEFRQQVQQVQDKQQGSDNKQDPMVVQQQVAQRIVADKLFTQECNEASVDVTNGEITELLMQNPPQEIAQYCAQTNQDPRAVFEQLKKANPNDQNAMLMKKLYEDQGKQITLSLKAMKLQTLLVGCLQASKIDLALQKQANYTYDIEYAMVDYNSQAASVKVTDDEIKKVYEQFKEYFKIDDERRRISYIKVDVDPSAKDTAETNKKVKALYDALAEEGIRGLRSNDDTNVFIDSVPMRAKKSASDGIMDQLIAGGKGNRTIKYPQNIHDRNTYIYKVTNDVLCPDSIGLDQVQIIGNKAKQEALLAELNAGTKTIEGIVAELAKSKNDSLGAAKFDGKNIITAEQLAYNDSLRNKINANLTSNKYFFLDQSTEGAQQGAIIARVVKHSNPVNIYTVATVKYVDNPSDATIEKLRNGLDQYVKKNNTVANFKKNAKAAGYNVQEEVINSETIMLGNPQFYAGQMMGGIKDTYKVVKWAYDNKPGTISEVYTDDAYMLVVAVEDVYKDYIPYTDPQIKESLTAYVKTQKIAANMLNKYGQVKDVNAFAQQAGTQVNAIQLVPGAGSMINDGKVIGHLVGLGDKAVNKTLTIAGENGFYVIKVNKIEKPDSDMELQEAIRNYQGRYVQPHLQEAIMNSRKIDYNLIKFAGS